MEKHINFITQKRNRAKKDFEKDFYNLFVIAAFGKFLENVPNCLRLELIKKEDIKHMVEQQYQHSMVFINQMKTVIVIYSRKRSSYG